MHSNNENNHIPTISSFSAGDSREYSPIKAFHFARYLLLIFDRVSSLFIFLRLARLRAHSAIMWKTRFEVSTAPRSHHPRRRPLSSPPATSSLRSLPTVPRVRDDSPSAILRPLSSSSIPSLTILTEEEETDLTCPIADEQRNSPSTKQAVYPAVNKRRLTLPTIIESHDHEAAIDNRTDSPEADDHPPTVCAINTNYAQVLSLERKLQSKHQRKVRELVLAFAVSACQ